MTAEGRLAPASAADALVARLENVPFSRWHFRPRVVVGTATFFDAFDALSLAFVLPVLAPLWQLSPRQIGVLIAIGYLGQRPRACWRRATDVWKISPPEAFRSELPASGLNEMTPALDL